VEGLDHPAHVGGDGLGQVLTGEVPDDGAQVRGSVEGDAVIDTPDVVALVAQAMARLAIGVVDDVVEGGEVAEPLGEVVEQGEVVLLRVMVDEQLNHPDPHRTVAKDRRRDDRPTKGLRELEGGHFPLTQRAVGEVPERALAPPRLVHREGVGADVQETSQEGLVRRPRHAADHLELTALEKNDGLLGRDRPRRAHARCPLEAGHTWPLGSRGSRHHGHGGRPAATVSVPRAAMARIWVRVANSRANLGSGSDGSGGAPSTVSSAGACSYSSRRTRRRSGSKPMPMTTARKRGTAGSLISVSVAVDIAAASSTGSSGCSSATWASRSPTRSDNTATCSFST